MASMVADSVFLLSRAASLSGSAGASAASTTDGTSAFDDLVAATLSGAAGSAAATAQATTTEVPTLAGGVMSVVVPTDDGEGTTTLGPGQSAASSSTATTVGTLLPVVNGKETGGVDLVGDWTSTEAPGISPLASGVVGSTPSSDSGASTAKETGGVDVVGDWTSTEAPATPLWSPSAAVETPSSASGGGIAQTSLLSATVDVDALAVVLQQASYATASYQPLVRLGQAADFEA